MPSAGIASCIRFVLTNPKRQRGSAPRRLPRLRVLKLRVSYTESLWLIVLRPQRGQIPQPRVKPWVTWDNLPKNHNVVPSGFNHVVVVGVDVDRQPRVSPWAAGFGPLGAGIQSATTLKAQHQKALARASMRASKTNTPSLTLRASKANYPMISSIGSP